MTHSPKQSIFKTCTKELNCGLLSVSRTYNYDKVSLGRGLIKDIRRPNLQCRLCFNLGSRFLGQSELVFQHPPMHHDGWMDG